MSKVRVRFAPSPTGALHIGGIRTALYNYLFAKKHGGDFLLRIEDTDQGRYVEGAEQYIIKALSWIGLNPDEGPNIGGKCAPYRQSERQSIYHKYAQELIASGKAYYAFDTTEELDQMRNAGEGNNKYDAFTRGALKNSLSLSPDETKQYLANSPTVIRLKVDADQEVVIQDIIRGTVSFNTNILDDKVLIKSDGLPTYHMANVVDDHLMEISHVIRGEEWLSSTAHHVLLYRAFGWEDTMPQFSHLPLILKPTGNGKLSKRDGAQFGFPVFPIDWKEQDIIGFDGYGFEPEALINFLALLGWNNGTDQEVFSIQELIQEFSLEKIVKSGARFDFEKAKWFNQQYIHKKDPSLIQQYMQSKFEQLGLSVSEIQIQEIYELFKDRAQFQHDFVEKSKVYFHPIAQYDLPFIQSKWKPEFTEIFSGIKSELGNIAHWTTSDIEPAFKSYIKGINAKPGDIFPLMRVVLTGQSEGPDLMKALQLCGKNEVIKRLDQFIALEKNSLKA